MKERANAMIRVARIMESLPTNDDRRVVAFEVWRSFGSPQDLKRAVERERKQARRDTLECPTAPTLFLGQSADNPGTIRGQSADNPGTIRPNSPTPPASGGVVFQIPDSIRTALQKCEFLGKASVLWNPEYWRAEIRAFPRLDYAAVILEAEAFVHASSAYRPRKRFRQFMHRQLRRAAERQEE